MTDCRGRAVPLDSPKGLCLFDRRFGVTRRVAYQGYRPYGLYD